MRHLRRLSPRARNPVCVRALSGICPVMLLRFQVQPFAANSKPGVRWNTTRLHAKGYISDPKSKAKSVGVTVKGVQ